MSPRARRSASIFVGLALGAVVLLSWSQPWFVVALAGQSAAHPDLEVAGDVGAPAAAALALASAAAFGAMAISGRLFRVFLAAVESLIGIGIVLSCVLALADPIAAVEAAVTKATGIAGVDSVTTIVESAVATAWPFIGLIAGIMLVMLGVTILFTGRGWPPAGSRYETAHPRNDAAAGGGGDHSVADWDELSGGADPTSR